MSEFIPKEGLITRDCYLHVCGTLDDIGSKGRIVYVSEKYFVIENLYSGTAIVVNEDNYWVIQEEDFQ